MLTCVAGAGNGEGKSGAHSHSGKRGGREKEAPAASPLFISSSSFAGKRKIARAPDFRCLFPFLAPATQTRKIFVFF